MAISCEDSVGDINRTKRGFGKTKNAGQMQHQTNHQQRNDTLGNPATTLVLTPLPISIASVNLSRLCLVSLSIIADRCHTPLPSSVR